MRLSIHPVLAGAAVLGSAPWCSDLAAAPDPKGDSPQPAADVTSLDASGDGGKLHIKLTTAAEYEFSNTQLLIDSDLDPRTGFAVDEVGADLMVEGGRVFRFGGGDDVEAWSWDDHGEVERDVEGSTLTVTVPGTLFDGTAVSLIARTLTEEYAVLDRAPDEAALLVRLDPSGNGDPAATPDVPPSEAIGDSDGPARDITAVKAVQQGGELIITATTAEAHDFATTLIFFDTDSDADTGHQPSADPRFGFEMLLTGGTLSTHAGDDRAAWQWEAVGQAEQTVSGNTLTVKIDPALLGGGESVRFAVWNMTHDWQSLADQAPDEGLYEVKLDPSHFEPASISPTVAPAPRKVDADLPPRRRVAESDSFYTYYGSGKVAELSHYDVAVLHSPQMKPADIAKLNDLGVVTIGYLTVGEDDEKRTGDGTGPAGLASWYLDRDDDGQPDRNSIWNSWYANANDPKWRADRVKEAKRLVEEEGYHGIFLDTLDTAQLYPETQDGMVQLVADLREALPESPIILNQGFRLFDRLAPMADGLMLESFTATYDFDSKTYMLNYPASLDAHTKNVQRNLQPVLEEHPMPIFVLDYARPDDREAIQTAADRAATFGYQFAAAPIFLDDVYVNDIEGEPNPKWLEMQATPESMSIVLAEPANGFAAGTKFTPSSCYAGYSVTPLVDDIGDRDGLSWSKAAWASSEDDEQASLTMTLPRPVEDRKLRITWATDSAIVHASAKYHVQTRMKDGEWENAGPAGEHTSDSSTHVLPGSPFDQLRIVQPRGGGSTQRPDLLWIAQLELLDV